MSLYPRHLLPRVYYKRIPPTIIPPKTHFLRFIDDMQISTSEEMQNSCEKILNPSHFPNGCSMNILSVFTKEDVKYKLIKTDTPIFESWAEGLTSYVPQDEEVTIIENRCFCGIDYSKVMRYQADVGYVDRNNNKKRGIATFVFMHAPLLSNFWHYNMFMKLSLEDGNKEVICERQNPVISDSQIRKLVVAQLDDLKEFLIIPSETKPCKIYWWKYYSVKSMYKYIKKVIQIGCTMFASRNVEETIASRN